VVAAAAVGTFGTGGAAGSVVRPGVPGGAAWPIHPA